MSASHLGSEETCLLFFICFILDEALFWFSRNILVISILLVFPTPDSIKYVGLFAGSFKLETETDLWNKKKKLTSEWARWRGRNQFCYKESCWQWHNTQQTGLSSKKAIYHFNCQGRFTDFRHSLNQRSDDDVKTPSLGFIFLYVDFIPRQIPSMLWQRWPHRLGHSSRRKSISSENNVNSPWEDSGLAWITKQPPALGEGLVGREWCPLLKRDQNRIKQTWGRG